MGAGAWWALGDLWVAPKAPVPLIKYYGNEILTVYISTQAAEIRKPLAMSVAWLWGDFEMTLGRLRAAVRP